MQSKFNIGALIENIDRVKVELPILLANQAQRHFTSSWQQQGYEGTPWKEVQRREPGTPEYKYPKYKGLTRRTKPILVNTGHLRRDTANSIRSQSWDMIRLVSATPYGSYVNNGTPKMDARPFMRDSPGLRTKQKELITITVDKALGI